MVKLFGLSMYLLDQIECIFRYWYFVDDFQIPLIDIHNFAHNVTNADLSRFNNLFTIYRWPLAILRTKYIVYCAFHKNIQLTCLYLVIWYFLYGSKPPRVKYPQRRLYKSASPWRGYNVQSRKHQFQVRMDWIPL